MLYEPMLVGSKPYRVGLCNNCNYQSVHCHKEVEILYVVSGEMQLLLNNQPLVIKTGEAVFVESMVRHFVTETGEDTRFLFLEIGPFFLGKNFEMLTNLSRTQPMTKQDNRTKGIFLLLDEIVCEKQTPTAESEMIIRGNLYKLTAQLHRLFPKKEKVLPQRKERLFAAAVEELIQTRYHTSLTVKEAADLCGYSVSSFCRIFKTAFGVGFHTLLNQVRMEKAQLLLQDTTLTVSEIARQTGFVDTKAFCRLFKKQHGMTATAFRQGVDD